MNEKDFLDKIKHSADDVTPPDSLNPEAVEEKLSGINSQKRLTAIYRLGGLAAAVALAFTLSWAVRSSYLEGVRHSASPTENQTDSSGAGITGKHGAIPAADMTDTSSDTVADTADTSAVLEDTGHADILSEETADITIPAIDGAESYEAIYQALRNAFYYEDDLELLEETDIAYDGEVAADVAEEDMNMGAAPEIRTESVASTDNAVDSVSYSTTNIQEIGVDEGDIVKTDGKYLYILKKSGSLLIVSADGGDIQLVFSVPLPLQESVKEMYVDGDRLSVIATGYDTVLSEDAASVYSASSKYRTSLYTYDISDRAHPVLAGTVTQDGTYSQSRKNGDFIYLFTRYFPSIAQTYEESDLIPATSRGELSASEIYLPEHLNYTAYLVASSVNIQEADTVIDQKAVVSVGSTFYASRQNIYIANENWLEDGTMTELIRLHYEDGQIIGAAAGSVKGYLNNSFSLNEYNGYLRVVSTYYDDSWMEKNGLYILDGNLNMVGAIQDLAPNETIRSARFFGDVGYFVTFRQTDPLFSVDLADPANPMVLGTLKVSGFSSYLHFYGDNLLLGMGYEADENTGIRTGLKLSMFDISDPSDVKEVHRLVLNGITWCNSLDDYKMILIDPEKNLFGFTCENRYLLFSYDPEQGFVKEFIYDFYNDLISASFSAPQENAENVLRNEFGFYDYQDDDALTRGIYIGDTLYLVRQNMVTAFDMKDSYREIGRLEI